MPGFGELLIILAIVLVIFGAKRVPEIFEALGKGVRNFRRATREEDTVQVTGRTEGTSSLPPASDTTQEAKVRSDANAPGASTSPQSDAQKRE